jgi:hypothetical protein
MKSRWAPLIAAVAAALVLVPLATAGAQAPTTTTDPDVTAEGSFPPGGTVNCTTGATLDPDHGPPGTFVTVLADFFGNCDGFFVTDYPSNCIGTVTGEGLEQINFPMLPGEGKGQPELVGTFTAPVTEPNPPVADAIEPLTVTISCEINPPVSAAEGGPGSTTYNYPPVTYDLELFADIDTDQPTVVDNDVDDGVVDATPTFTG